MKRLIQRYLKDRGGAAGAEFALLALVFAMVLLGIIDFNRAMWEYNEAEKSCRVGARFAVVHNMVAPGMYTWDGQALGLFDAGDELPVGAISPDTATCTCSNISGDPPACGSVSCDNWGPASQSAFDDILQEMESVYPRLAHSDTVITIKYEHIGMGFAGNPIGPDVWPLTTVEVAGPEMVWVTPFVGGIAPVNFDCSASLTGEDFQTCPDGVSSLPCPGGP